MKIDMNFESDDDVKEFINKILDYRRETLKDQVVPYFAHYALCQNETKLYTALRSLAQAVIKDTLGKLLKINSPEEGK